MEANQIRIRTFEAINRQYPKAYYEIEKYLKAAYEDEIIPINIIMDDDSDMLYVMTNDGEGEVQEEVLLVRDLFDFFDYYGIKISLFTINHEKKKGLFTYAIDGFPAYSMELCFSDRAVAESAAFVDASRILELIIEGKL